MTVIYSRGSRSLNKRIFLVIGTLRRTLSLLGCLFFVFSFVYPLAHGQGVPGHGPVESWRETSVWSYRYERRGRFFEDTLWFFNYWFGGYLVGQNVSFSLMSISVSISVFVFQILTLLFGTASIVSKRRSMLIVSMLLSGAVLTLTMCMRQILLSIGFSMFPLMFPELQLGYYVMFPSFVLFLSATVLSEATRSSVQVSLRKPLFAVVLVEAMLIGCVLYLYAFGPNEVSLFTMIVAVAVGATMIITYLDRRRLRAHY